uniref:Tumor necrosis factor receptor superfamily member 6 n=1 Tax=Calidris pygmaea TaxID=425635 RepID=A0A8C3KLK7_9CHAR
LNCPTNTGEHCRQCEEGKEYIDYTNELDKCSRCSVCDKILGTFIEINCTPEQNTKCTCAENHFCTSALPCSHCHPCTLLYRTRCFFPAKSSLGNILSHEYLKLNPFWVGRVSTLNIDLSSHITDIVEQMTIKQVMKFVRRCRVPEPVIDQTVRDYPNDTDEQKIKLFQVWYQRQGIKGAYHTLITSLRELRMRAAADKIEEKLKRKNESSRNDSENRNSPVLWTPSIRKASGN